MNNKSVDCESLIHILPGWLTDELSTVERATVEAHLAKCPACRQELALSRQLWQQLGMMTTPQPGPQVHTRFYAMLAAEEAEAKTHQSGMLANRFWGRLRWLVQQLTSPPALRVAYSVLLLGVGLLAGYWFADRRAPAMAYQQRIDTLSTQMQAMREMMMLSLLENPSATERLRAVGYTKDIGDVNAHVIDALLMTLNNDPNVNVRLVTLEALADLAQDTRVREGLVQSLPRQESPLVQVALADVMVKLQEKRSLKPLKQMLRQQGLNSLVKTKLEKTIRDLS